MKYQFYCDMDNVLCDFESSALSIMNDALANPEKYGGEIPALVANSIEEVGKNVLTKEDIVIGTPNKEVRKLMKALVKHNRDFWANLGWNPGGKEIWNAIKDYNPYILSAPMGESEECKAGKRDWIRKNLTPAPERIILDDEKWKYTSEGDKTGVLIDDLWSNIRDYRKHGGIGVHHKAFPVTLRLIQTYKGK